MSGGGVASVLTAPSHRRGGAGFIAKKSTAMETASFQSSLCCVENVCSGQNEAAFEWLSGSGTNCTASETIFFATAPGN